MSLMLHSILFFNFCFSRLQEEATETHNLHSGDGEVIQPKIFQLGNKNVDIMQILSGAQQRYEKVK